MKQNLIEMWDIIKCTNIHVMGVPESRELGGGCRKIIGRKKNAEEIVAEMFQI